MKAWASILVVALAGLSLSAPGARKFNGSNQYINSASLTWSGQTITISAWVYLTATNNAEAVASISSAGNTRVQIGFSAAGAPNATSVNTGGTSASAQGATGTCSPNTLYHLCGVWESTSSRKIYLNGVPVATNTTAITLGTPDRFTIGMRISSSAAGLFSSARIAEVGAWNVALDAGEIASLAAGARPIRVRPTALKVYFPLAGASSPEPNWIGTAGTLTNAPTADEHPRIY